MANVITGIRILVSAALLLCPYGIWGDEEQWIE